MSQENVEIVRRALRAMDRDLDRVVRFWAPDIDWRAIEGAPDDVGLIKGREALRRYYEQWYEMFDGLRGDAQEVIDGGEDRVVVVMRVAGRMKGSEAEVDMRLAILYTVRNGLIVRGREYATREDALQAAGLSE